MYEKSFGMLHGVRIRVCGTGDWQSFIEAWRKFKPKKTRPTILSTAMREKAQMSYREELKKYNIQSAAQNSFVLFSGN